MTKSVKEIAEEAMPGWKVVQNRAERSKAKPAKKGQIGTPDLSELRRRYLGESVVVSDGFVSASSFEDDDTEYVEMAPKDPASQGIRRTVIISKGKAVAVQG